MEKLNLTQQRHTFTNQKKCTTTQNKHKETKARFSHLVQHPTTSGAETIVVLALHKFVTYLLRHLPLTHTPGTHTGATKIRTDLSTNSDQIRA